MRDSHWFRRLEIALEFDSGFEIFLLLGRGELARPGLARVAEELRRFGAPHWHRLHLDGLDGLLTDEQPEGVLHLVHGFERMSESVAADMAARLNVNRDRLEVLRGPVIFWIPEDFYEELLRQAPDFVAWRSQASVVADADLGISSEVLAEEFLLCQTHRAAEEALRDVPPLDVLDSDVRRPVLDWLAEGDTRSLCCEPQDAPLDVMLWCAGQLARRREAGDYNKVPVVLPSVLLVLVERNEFDDLRDDIARLWQTGILHVVVAAPITVGERDSLFARVGLNRVLVTVRGDEPDCVSISALSSQQVQLVIDLSLFDHSPREREAWQQTLAETVRLFGDRVSRFGVLAAVVSHWHDMGLFNVTSGLRFRGWREYSFRKAKDFYVDPSSSAPAVPLLSGLDVLARSDRLSLAQSLYEFGARSSGDLHEPLLRASISLSRIEAAPIASVTLVRALIALGRSVELGTGEEIWMEAVSLARNLWPEHPTLLVEALDGLGSAQHFAEREDEAQQTVREALSLAMGAGESSGMIVELRSTLAYSLLAQDRFEEALAAAEQGLHDLEAVSPTDDVRRESLLFVCDDACSHLGMEDRALEFAARELESRRRLTRLWWGEQARFAERLLHSGKPERALAVVTELIDHLSLGDNEPPHRGRAWSLTILAAIHRALGDRDAAASAMQEAVRAYRALIADDGSQWWMGELAQTLLALSGDLEQLDRAEALDHLHEAVEILEQLASPGQYPDDLAAALTQLGEYAAAKKMYALATAAFARILVLAAPFPARTSEPVLAIEQRLVALCEESLIPLDDALARGQHPIAPDSDPSGHRG